MARLRAALALALAAAAGAPPSGKGKQKPREAFTQNCAARKLCNRPLSERDASANAASGKAASAAPKGHLLPLGHPDFGASWAGEIDSVEDMDPQTFWTKYWPKRPFKLKGFAKKSPAYTKWRDDAYIKENFGHFKAKCEPKNEDRLTDYCGQVKFGQRVKCGKDIIPYTETHMRLGKFVDHYRHLEFDKYVITQMPDAMASDFVVPSFHACARRHRADPGPAGGGRWMTQMYENNFWLSYNGGRNFSTSVIHYDMNHQIMCQFDGTKEWFMWDMASEGKHIPMWSGLYNSRTNSAKGSDDSPIDGERVDLVKWPAFAQAKWSNTTLEAGDCLYTPALHLHYVRSYGRNAAGMTMFQGDERYDTDCGGAAPGGPSPLSAYDTMWSFPEEDKSLFGWNVVKMGYPNWKRLWLWPLADKAEKATGGRLRRRAFTKHVARLMKEAGGSLDGWEARAHRAFDEMDADGDGAVEAERLFGSRELRFLLKDLAVEMEGGRGEQEEDTEVDRFDLQGTQEKRRLEL